MLLLLLLFWEKGSSGDSLGEVSEQEVVKNDSEVATVSGGRQSGVPEGEAGGVSGFGEGFWTDDV